MSVVLFLGWCSAWFRDPWL